MTREALASGNPQGKDATPSNGSTLRRPDVRPSYGRRLDPDYQLRQTGWVVLKPIAERFTDELLRRRIEAEDTRFKKAAELSARQQADTVLKKAGITIEGQPKPRIKHKLHPFIALRHGPFSPKYLTRPLPQSASEVEKIRAALRYTKAIGPEGRRERLAHKAEVRMLLGRVRQILDVRTNAEIYDALRPEVRRKKLARAVDWISGLFAIPENKDMTRREKIKDYLSNPEKSQATYIDGLRLGILEPGDVAQALDRTEELKGEKVGDDPIELLRLAFDENESLQVRHEAIRALEDAEKIAAIDKRARQKKDKTRGEGLYDQFTGFLDKHLWQHDPITGKPLITTVHILSGHSYDDYSCLGTTVISAKDLKAVSAAAQTQDPERTGIYYRIRPLPVRTFVHKGKAYTAYIEKRPEKKLQSQITKLYGEGESDPTHVLKDDMGVMFIVRNKAAAYYLVEALNEAARKSNTPLEEVTPEDTLSGGQFSAERVGSSGKIRVLKYHYLFKGDLIEVITEDDRADEDYQHSDDFGHKKYEISRLFDPPVPRDIDPDAKGAYELHWPEEIYGQNPDQLKATLLARKRQEIRNQSINAF